MSLKADLYRKLYLIRAAETTIQKYYPENGMKTPMHMSSGSEAIAAGVCVALNKDDQVLCSYRSHACYLAKTGNTDDFFCEMYGKECGLGHGKAGSMHISNFACGHIMSSAIVASHLPVASGIAFANKMQKNGKMCAVFFGDGATDEGAFWETLNLACLMSLPLILVCEDNGFAVHTKKAQRQGYDNIDEIVSKFNCNTYRLEEDVSTDAEAVFNITKEAISAFQNNKRPCFIRIPYYRYLEHVGINEDFHKGYRPKEESDAWKAKDPILIARTKLNETEAVEIEQEIDAQINTSIRMAQLANFAEINELYKDVFYA